MGREGGDIDFVGFVSRRRLVSFVFLVVVVFRFLGGDGDPGDILDRLLLLVAIDSRGLRLEVARCGLEGGESDREVGRDRGTDDDAKLSRIFRLTDGIFTSADSSTLGILPLLFPIP